MTRQIFCSSGSEYGCGSPGTALVPNLSNYSYAPSLTSTLSIGSKIPGELPDSSGFPETISEFSIERSHRLDGGRLSIARRLRLDLCGMDVIMIKAEDER